MEVQETVLDFNKICRLCLMEESVMSSIYNDQDNNSSSVPLPLRIMACVSIELNSVDGLPSQICTTCLCQVDGWYKFKDLCETANEILKKCVKNEVIQSEAITQVRSKAKEVRQFFASPHLVKVEGLDSALSQAKAAKKPVEIAVKSKDDVSTEPEKLPQKYFVYVNPDTYFKRLQSEYKLSDKVTVKEIRKEREGSLESMPDYEIAFDSYIEMREKEFRRERLVMEMGDCQLLEVNPTEEDTVEEDNTDMEVIADEEGKHAIVEDHDYASLKAEVDISMSSDRKYRYRNPVVEEAVANYEKTKEYLENALRERGNTQEEIIENVMYTFRLDDDGNLDVVNIVEGVSEPHPQRGFRYACLFCSKMVANKQVYDKHIREDHLDYLVCKVCDKQLYSLRNFLIHTKTHLGVYTFTCPLCGKGLTRASIFKSHMMYHYYGKVQKCEICDKKFRDIFALRRHVHLHVKKIEYICELCGFGTHLKSNLDYHVRTHGDEKLFMCELCGKQFTAPQSLQHHMKTHEPKYPCQHCKRVYRYEDKFRNHLRQSHGDFVKNEKEIQDGKEEEEQEEDGDDEEEEDDGDDEDEEEDKQQLQQELET